MLRKNTHKIVHLIGLHLYEVLEQTKLIYGVESRTLFGQM